MQAGGHFQNLQVTNNTIKIFNALITVSRNS